MNNWESIEAIHGELYTTMDEAHAAYIAATYTEAEYLDEMGIHGEARQDWQRRQHAKENN